MRKRALFSQSKLYRYTLFRGWGDIDAPTMNFIMLNPSTADADNDDPTIRRCINFTKREGFTSLMVTNLFGFRATDPSELSDVDDPVGPENSRHVLHAAQEAEIIVCAWGTKGTLFDQDEYTKRLLRSAGCSHKVKCLKQTKYRHPQHPLYISGQQPLQEYEP